MFYLKKKINANKNKACGGVSKQEEILTSRLFLSNR